MSRLCHVSLPLLVYKVFNFTFWGSLGCFLLYIPLYFKQIGFSASEIGLVSSVRPFFGFLFLPFIAAAADRFRRRKAVLVASVILTTGILASFIVFPRASQVPCDVMEDQIREILHLNISLPYQEGQSSYYFPADADTVLSPTPSVLKRNIGGEGIPRHLASSFSSKAQQTSRNDSTVESSQFPRATQEILLANQGWLYDQAELRVLFVVILIVSSFIEVVVFSSACQLDNATLDALRREHGNVDQYGFNRGFGTLGWGACSLATGFLLNSTRTVEVSCGIEHTITSYWASFVSAVGLSVCALVCVAYMKFSYEGIKTDGAGSSWGAVKAVLFSWHYGSVLIMLIFLGICNGAVWGFLFWHLENLGATQGLLGVLTAVECVSEFSSGLLSGWAIPKVGHMPLLSLGLFLYIVRFCSYYLIRVPWVTFFVEPLQGMCFIMTWTTSVSYMTEAIPPENTGTMQGILISAHHGLGNGLGYFLTGLLITRFGAPWTFIIYAVSCTVVLFIFLSVQWFSQVPPLPWKPDEPVKSHTGEGREPDPEEMLQTQSLLDSPKATKSGKFSLKLPEFTLTTKTVSQQDPW
ncbi:major facilitator superfamily domain-containing protein 6-like [Patiria miniata]|uniref:Major facilitator superfamily associated domain-containing protein n=1 Tax=Patiria miniata TaxID=46514 RepID=A0A914BG78_PATMI|nr:major facilitator superfamily domain-containing protein 6-like [Patiria miniata]